MLFIINILIIIDYKINIKNYYKQYNYYKYFYEINYIEFTTRHNIMISKNLVLYNFRF